MSHNSELAARLEAEAVFFENIGKVPGNPEAKQWGEDLRAAAQAVRALEWRPIAEAPKTPWVKVLGYTDKQGILIMRWAPSAEGSINFAKGHPGDWITDDDTFIMPCKPNHYLPLPAPPEATR